MFSLKKENLQKYFNEIVNNLDEYSYRNKRYNVNYAIVLGFCTKDVNLGDLVDVKRRTDRYIPLEKNLCCVVFDCVDSESSLKAAQNLKKEVEKSCLKEDFFMRVATSIEHESALKMTNSLFKNLELFLGNLNAKSDLVTNG